MIAIHCRVSLSRNILNSMESGRHGRHDIKVCWKAQSSFIPRKIFLSLPPHSVSNKILQPRVILDYFTVCLDPVRYLLHIIRVPKIMGHLLHLQVDEQQIRGIGGKPWIFMPSAAICMKCLCKKSWCYRRQYDKNLYLFCATRKEFIALFIVYKRHFSHRTPTPKRWIGFVICFPSPRRRQSNHFQTSLL